MNLKNYFKRFIKYVTAGTFSLILDLSFLWLFVDKIGINYLYATALAFLLATSINYYINRNWSFADSSVRMVKSYVAYMGVAATGLLIILVSMTLLVQFLNMQYFLARVSIGLVIGVINYLVNHIFTFEIPFFEKSK
ncbi:MAG: GtrA family protein [archaeon]